MALTGTAATLIREVMIDEIQHVPIIGNLLADPDNPLFKLDQVVVTPHTAGSAIDLVGDIARHAFGNMQAVLNGEPLSPNDVIVAAGENR